MIARGDQEVPKNMRKFNKVMEIIKGKLLLPFFMVITFGILLKIQNAKSDIDTFNEKENSHRTGEEPNVKDVIYPEFSVIFIPQVIF